MLQLLKSRMGMMQAWTVIIMVAAEQAAGERWNRGKNQAGADRCVKASRPAPRMVPPAAARGLRASPDRPAPISRPMMMEAVPEMPKATTIHSFSTLPAMV